MSIYEPIFTSTQVAAAAGITSANMRAHFLRGNWRRIGKPAEENGFAHLFNIRDALGIALARELVDLGMHPREAFDRATLDWSHGDRCGELVDEENTVTLYVLREGDLGEVVGLKPDGALPWLVMFRSAFARAPRIVNLTALHRRVFESLGVDPVSEQTVAPSTDGSPACAGAEGAA